MDQNSGKALIVLVHGRGGNASTWKDFPTLLHEDQSIASRFDVAPAYEYSTNGLGLGPGIDEIAQGLAAHLRNTPLAAYASVVIIAHSMGGLVARRMVVDAMIAGEHLRVTRILTFATPHLGTALAQLPSRQDRDLAIGSQFITRLGRDWANTTADRKVQLHTVVAADDSVVGQWSATAGFRSSEYDLVAGAGHQDIVKPNDPEAPAFQIARRFLLSHPRPGHHPPDARHFEQPWLDLSEYSDNRLDRDNAAWLWFRARTTPFFGRDTQWRRLNNFVSSRDPMRWTAIIGDGGSGKSRLALEFCLAVREHWYAGFLPDAERNRDWLRWQPIAPTLLVLDYATQNTDSLRLLLHSLAARTLPGSAMPLTQPVRVILLLRPGEEIKLNEDVVPRGDAAIPVRSLNDSEAIVLPPIEDSWPIFEAVFTAANRPLPNRDSSLQALERIDPQKRPLFAMLVADAMTLGDMGKFDPANVDQQRLLTDVLDRWRARFWQPACDAAGFGSGAGEETLLALATMCGGLRLTSGRTPSCQIQGLLPQWDPHRHPKVFRAMTGRSVEEVIPPLEPDLLGETFVLREWGCKRTPTERAALQQLAWAEGGLAYFSFLDRLSQDFRENGNDGVLQDLLFQPPPSTNKSAWANLAINTVGRGSSGNPDVWNTQLHRLRLEAAADSSLLWHWSMYAVNVLRYLGRLDLQKAQALLREVRQQATARNDAESWRIWGIAAFNLIDELIPVGRARALLDDMRGIAIQRGEGALWASWARGAYNFLCDLRTTDPSGADKLLKLMRKSAQLCGEGIAWEQWAKGAVNVSRYQLERDDRTARKLIEQIGKVAAERQEPALYLQWALGIVNLTTKLCHWDIEAARNSVHDVRAAAQTRNDSNLWILWAKSVLHLLTELVVRDPEAADELLEELLKVAGERNEPIFWSEWAKATFNMASRVPNASAWQWLTKQINALAEMRKLMSPLAVDEIALVSVPLAQGLLRHWRGRPIPSYSNDLLNDIPLSLAVGSVQREVSVRVALLTAQSNLNKAPGAPFVIVTTIEDCTEPVRSSVSTALGWLGVPI